MYGTTYGWIRSLIETAIWKNVDQRPGDVIHPEQSHATGRLVATDAHPSFLTGRLKSLRLIEIKMTDINGQFDRLHGARGPSQAIGQLWRPDGSGQSSQGG